MMKSIPTDDGSHTPLRVRVRVRTIEGERGEKEKRGGGGRVSLLLTGKKEKIHKN